MYIIPLEVALLHNDSCGRSDEVVENELENKI